MNRLTRRPWFLPGVGVMLYLTGVNDEVLGLVGSAWLSLSRQVQTVTVLVLLVVAGALLGRMVRGRRAAYAAAVQAATMHMHVDGKG